MKTRFFHIIFASFTATFIQPIFAIEAPVDNAAPPTAAAGAREAKPAVPAKPGEKVETAFLGVVTTEVPAILAEHLNLKAGEGVLVHSLQPEGPAAKAGITGNDIITRIAGKDVGSTLEVGEKVRSHKPGETIRLDVIHKGKPKTLDVALGTRPQTLENMPDLQELDLGAPEEMHDRIREMKKRIGDIELKMGDLDRGEMLKGMHKFEIHNGASFRMMDANGSIEMKSNDGGKEITVKDANDQVTWSGPWDTEQDKAAAPADIRQRIERLNIDNSGNGKHLRFKMGMGGIVPQPELKEDEGDGE